MSSEAPAETPQDGGALTNRISKPDDSKPSGTQLIKRATMPNPSGPLIVIPNMDDS